MEQMYQLKLAIGKPVEWPGKDGEDAARRYVDTFREAIVVATRLASSESYGVWVLGNAVIR
jgi:hypothetical protein